MQTALVYVACALIWGTTWFAIRRCIGDGGYPTFGGAALRFVIAATVLGMFYALGRGRPGPRSLRQLRDIAGCGALSAVSYGLIYAAERNISGGLAALLYGTFPLFTALIATVLRVEKVTTRALVGSGIALIGIAVVFVDRAQVSRAQGASVLLVLASVFVSALYSTVLKRAADGVSEAATTGVFLATAAIVLGLFAACFERKPLPWPPPPGPTVALFYLAIVGSVVVFAAYFFLLKRLRLMTLSTLVLLEPLVALVVDAAFEHDVTLAPRTYIGMGVTIGAVALSVSAPNANGSPGFAEKPRISREG